MKNLISEEGKENPQMGTHSLITDRGLHKQSEAYIYNVLMQTPVAMLIIKKEDYIIEFANDFYLHVINKDKSVIGKPFFEVLPEALNHGFKSVLDNIFETGLPHYHNELEFSYARENKLGQGFFNVIRHPLRALDGTITGIITAISEVTEQVLARKIVEETEFQYHNMIYTSSSAIGILQGEDMIITTANDALIEILGKGNDIIGKPYFELMPELVAQGYKEVYQEIYTSGKPFFAKETPVDIWQSGKLTRKYYDFNLQPHRQANGDINGIGILATEITAQAENNKKLKESEQRYRNLIENSPTAIYTCDKDGYIQLFNKAAVDIWGREPQIGIDRWCGSWKLFDIDGVLIPIEQCPMAMMLKQGSALMDMRFEAFIEKPNGERRFVVHHVQPIFDENGALAGGINTLIDMTEIKNAELEIRKSEAHFRLMAEFMPEKITNAQPDGTIIFYNKSWQNYTGASFDEMINEGWGKWVHADEVHETTQRWLHSVATGDDFDMELRILNQQGEYRWHSSRARAMKDEKGGTKLWIGFNADVHEQKKHEAILEKTIAHRTDELQAERISNEKTLQKNNHALEQKNKELIALNNSLLQKNKEIEEAKEKLLSDYARGLIEASPDPLITINTEGKIMDVNQAMVVATGKSREILRGTDFSLYFTEPDKAREVYQAVFDKGFVKDYPLTIKDHKLTDVLFNGSVYKDEKGKILGAVVVGRDITEQKRIEKDLVESVKEIKDYKYALDASSIVDVVDNKGIVKYVNDNFCLISQYSSDEIVGKNFRFLTSDYHSEAFWQNLVETITDGKIWRDEICKQAKDGSIYWVLTTIVPFLNEHGKPYQYVSIRTDITDQKRIEKELIEAKVFAEMATVIAEVAKSKAENAALIAENAVKSKQQFLSNMSHEIRTPMNAIIGFTKVMLKTELTGKQKEYLTAVKMSGDALIVLINDILDLAKVDAGKMTFEQTPFKMSASISAMLHLFETKIQEKNLTLIKEYDNRIPEVLLGDPVRLHQIIMNLISNAVKFTTEGHIKVSVQLLKQTDENVTLEFAVSDTGIGITTENLDAIFENFQQASNDTTRIFGGTGLGLAIVKQLVEPQGGTVNVDSTIGKGSTFSFTLDFEKTNAEAVLEMEIPELDTEIKNIKVLVVEDMALNQLLMKTVLDDFGFDRDIADNGKIAIEKLRNKTYDIVLMDLQMPEMNGFDATEYIRNTLKSKVPIIALTADVTTVDLAKCKAVGMNDYIAKPVDERLLYSKIMGLVKKTASTHLNKENNMVQTKKMRCTNLTYLSQRTKSNAELMAAMIDAYLEQTPPLISAMKQSFQEKDWGMLHSAIHKMIPSFAIVGINTEFESMAKKVMEYAKSQKEENDMPVFVTQLEDICTQACEELKEELNALKNKK